MLFLGIRCFMVGRLFPGKKDAATLPRLGVAVARRLARPVVILLENEAPPPGAQAHEAAHWRFGNLWEKKGDKNSARAAYQAALAINPSFPQAIEALKKLN